MVDCGVNNIGKEPYVHMQAAMRALEAGGRRRQLASTMMGLKTESSI